MSDAVLITLILAFSVTTVASPFLSWWDRSSLLRALDNGDIPRVRIAGRVLVDRGRGWPLTNERPTAEGGRVQDFEQRTATWHPSGVVTSEQKDVQ